MRMPMAVCILSHYDDLISAVVLRSGATISNFDLYAGKIMQHGNTIFYD